MTIGASIFLIAVVGLILMLAGLAGLLLGLFLRASENRRAGREVLIEDRRDPRQPPY
jgi:hypothetical protein